MVHILPVEEFCWRNGPSSEFPIRVRLEDYNDTVWIWVWQRTQQNSIDDAENRRIRSDADCQRQHDHGREPGIPPEYSPPIPNVLPESLHGCAPSSREEGAYFTF